MRRFKQLTLAIVATIGVALLNTGCKSVGFVEGAEKSLQSASHTMETYIDFADRHRDDLGSDALKIAEEIRTNGPKIALDAFNALQVYKESRDDTDKTRFIQIRDTLMDLISRASTYLSPSEP